MRIDRFLWFARLVKTRRAAQVLSEEGRMRLGGRRIDRAHAIVRPGEVLTLQSGGRVRALRIEVLPIRRGPASEARACYHELLPIDAPPEQS